MRQHLLKIRKPNQDGKISLYERQFFLMSKLFFHLISFDIYCTRNSSGTCIVNKTWYAHANCQVPGFLEHALLEFKASLNPIKLKLEHACVMLFVTQSTHMMLRSEIE